MIRGYILASPDQLVRMTWGISVNTTILVAFISFIASSGLFAVYYFKYHPRVSYLEKYDCIKELSCCPRIGVKVEEIPGDTSDDDDEDERPKPPAAQKPFKAENSVQDEVREGLNFQNQVTEISTEGRPRPPAAPKPVRAKNSFQNRMRKGFDFQSRVTKRSQDRIPMVPVMLQSDQRDLQEDDY